MAHCTPPTCQTATSLKRGRVKEVRSQRAAANKKQKTTCNASPRSTRMDRTTRPHASSVPCLPPAFPRPHTTHPTSSGKQHHPGRVPLFLPQAITITITTVAHIVSTAQQQHLPPCYICIYTTFHKHETHAPKPLPSSAPPPPRIHALCPTFSWDT